MTTRILPASALAALALLGISLIPATAGVVFSESFEAPVVSGYANSTIPSGGKWIGSSGTYGSDNRGLYNEIFAWPATAPFTTPYGAQAFYLNYGGAGLTTSVGTTGQTLTAGVTYKVSFNTAVAAGTASGIYQVELVAFGPADTNTTRVNCGSGRPGTILGSSTGTVTTTNMATAATIVFTPAVGNAHLGKDLGIRLVKSTNSVLYDNIRLVAGHDMNPSPASGVTVASGNVPLSWTNMPPVTGTDVYVDVWFGTNPAALTKVVNGTLNTNSTSVTAPSAGTYYWRVDSYLNGSPTGSPVTGDVFFFVVTDTDNDGLPDTYELANTSPSSATALNPGDDLDTDGLTNLQEYFYGTGPNNPDSDNDTLLDGPEIAGAGQRPATNPLLADTDADGLSDAVESNTGIWGGASNTGTNPVDADWDNDGLKDGVEKKTGVFVSRTTDTGTDPYLADTDNDGAGDWYEVAATFTNPNSAAEKSPIPYPLPDPDASTGVTNKPVKVYIMSGQSNMVGIGYVNGTAPGSLETIAKRENKFPNLVTAGNAWTTRQDVRYRGVVTAIGNAPLTAGQGADATKIGPELGFGHVMGWYHGEPVLLLKSSQGNRSLGWDFLPPGSPQFTYNGSTYAGYGDSPASWVTGATPVPINWCAGFQYDQCFLAEADMSPKAQAVGAGGINVTDILDTFATQYPSWAAQGFEIAGYVWWQGNKDIGGAPYMNRYETNMVQFIKELRAYYANRYPGKCSTTTPFVLATGCGDPQTSGNGLVVANAQLATSDPVKHPEFAGNVKTMDIRSYWRSTAESPGTQGFHYNNNAETYMLTGDALGRGMIDLLEDNDPPSPNPPTFATEPTAVNSTTVGMVATTASDASGPVEYYFENTTNTTHSGWITSTTWNSTALTTAVSYDFRFKARDNKGNETSWSAVASAAPGSDVTAPVPNPMTFATLPVALGENSISMTASTATDVNGVEYFFDCLTAGGHDSVWQDSPTYIDTGLSPSTQYAYQVRARDKSTGQNVTAFSSSASATTVDPDSTPPTPGSMTFAILPAAQGESSITMTAATASDVSGVEYFFDCLTPGGHDSGWQDSPSYIDSGLNPSTQYTYQVQARDKSPAHNTNTASDSASATTEAPDLTPPSYLSLSPADNSIDVAVAANLVLTFDEEITADTGFITIKNLSDSTQTAISINDPQVNLSGAVLTINPSTNFLPGKNFAIRIDATAFQDLAGNPFSGITDDVTWNFTSAVVPHVWTQTAGGAQAWNTGTNWLAGTSPIPISGDTVDFSSANIVATTTLTLGADRTAQLWKFGDATTASHDWIVDTTNSMILAGTTPTIQVVNRTATLNNVVDGTAGLTKSGAGILVLGNAANTFSGGLTLNAGQLTLGANAAMGDTANPISFTGNSTLDLTADVTGTTRQINLTSGFTGTLRLGASVDFATSGKVTGAGNLLLTQTGSGTRTVVLSNAANDFTGSLGIDLGGSGQAITATLGSLADDVGYGNIRFGTGTVQATLNLNTASPLTLTNRAIEFFNNGNALATFGNSSGTNAITVAKDLVNTGTGTKTLTLTAATGTTHVFAGNITNGSGTVAVAKSGAGNWTISGNLSHTGGLTVANGASGNLSLSGTNTYSGATTVGTGNGAVQNVLVIQGLQALSPNTSVTLTQNSTPSSLLKLLDDASGTITLPNNVTISHANTVQAIGILVGNNNTANGGTSSGTTTGSTIALNKVTFVNPSASQPNVGFNTYGANGYRLQLNQIDLPAVTAAMATWNAKVIASGPVTIAGPVQQLAGTTGTSGTILTLTLDGTNTGSLVSGDIKNPVDYPTNTLTRPLAVAKNGASVWTLTGNNTFSGGLTLSGLTAGSQLNLNSATALGTGTFTISGGNNAKFDNTSGVPLTLSTNNAQTWSNDFAFVGSNDLNLGTGAVTMGGTRNLTVTANTLTVGGAISSSAFNLTKSGSGNLVLGGANAYTGTTTVSAGKLFINGDQTAASGNVSVSANATLGGTGVIGGATTIAATGKLEFNLSTAPLSHDKLELAAARSLTFSGASTLTITTSGGATTGDYILLTAPGGIVGSVPATLILPANWLATVSKVGNDLVLNVTSTGVVTDPYTTWSGGAAFDADANGDGVKNGLAWLLGAATPSENALGKLPAAIRNGGNLRLTFRCLKSAGRGGVVLKVQSSNDLGASDPWTSHEAAVPDADSTVNGVIFDTTDDGDYITVIADIPAAGSKHFARLNATQ